MFDESENIHRYTRAQALADGTLIDVTPMANEAGIKDPTALTRAVWQEFVAVPEGVQAQDEPGRLWDVLYLLRCAISRSPDGDTLHYQLHVRNENDTPKPVTLKAVCGPDDDGGPCITIMLRTED
jgi:hypothetical protein